MKPIFTFAIIFANIFAFANSAAQSKNNETNIANIQNVQNVPIEPIPETNLFTGVYYKMGLRRFPLGYVTWTGDVNYEGSYYVQMDNRPEIRQNFEETGYWYNDIQWFFTESETSPGWYHLKNRGVPHALATWNRFESAGTSPSGLGRHIILNGNPVHADPDTLWKPVQLSVTNETRFGNLLTWSAYLQLRIKSVPKGVVTWSLKENQRSKDIHYIEVDNDPEHLNDYKIGNDWFEDTLFRFDHFY